MELITLGLISPIAGVIGIALGIYVYRQSPDLPTSKAFLFTMSLFLIGALLDCSLFYAGDYNTALWLGRGMLFTVVLLFASILYLASYLPYERFSGWFRDKEMMLTIIAVLSAVIAAMPADVMMRPDGGWDTTNSLAFLIWTGIILTYIFITIIMIHKTCKGVKWERTRKQSRLLTLSVASPAFYAFFMQGMESLNISIPFTLSPGFLVLASVLAYGILRYRLFLPSQVQETYVKPIKTVDLERIKERNLILIKEKRPERSYRVFLSLLADKRVGLIITRSHPDIVREEYRLEKTPVIWLARQPGPNRIEPSNISILKHAVNEYLRQGEKAVVIIDSLEYIMENNDPDKVMRMLFDLRDEIIMTDSTLIISLDPDTIENQKMAYLEREFNVVAI